MSLLSVENLSFSIDGTKLLENISFSLEKGSLTLVAGKNGSGKSMLLKCLKGLERPDQGVIEIDGRPLKKERERMKELIPSGFRVFPGHGNVKIF